MALIARGVQRATEDLDIVYARDRQNLARLAEASRHVRPKLRGVPGDLPFVLDETSLRSGLISHPIVGCVGQLFGAGAQRFEVVRKLSLQRISVDGGQLAFLPGDLHAARLVEELPFVTDVVR